MMGTQRCILPVKQNGHLNIVQCLIETCHVEKEKQKPMMDIRRCIAPVLWDV